MRRILEGCMEEEKVGRVQESLARSARMNFGNCKDVPCVVLLRDPQPANSKHPIYAGLTM